MEGFLIFTPLNAKVVIKNKTPPILRRPIVSLAKKDRKKLLNMMCICNCRDAWNCHGFSGEQLALPGSRTHNIYGNSNNEGLSKFFSSTEYPLAHSIFTRNLKVDITIFVKNEKTEIQRG